MSSFHQQAIHFLCADPMWARQIWDYFSAASPDLRLSLVTWVVEGRCLQRGSLTTVVQRVLKVRHDLLSRLQRGEKKLSGKKNKNLSSSLKYNDLLRAQWEETEEAEHNANYS